MQQTDHPRLRLLLAIAASICLVLLVRHLAIGVALIRSGHQAAAIGAALIGGLTGSCLLIASLRIFGCRVISRIEQVFLAHSAWVVWGLTAMIALPVLFFTVPDGWDEARHIQYGMFLRGYGVSQEPLSWLVVRSPLASFFSALVFPFTQVINPVLFAALVVVMLAWCRRYAHPALVVFILLVMIANDHFMQAIWAVMGELPGGLFLVAAFYLLSRERFATSAVCLALAVLARWNLAPFAIIAVLFVAMRVSWRPALIMAGVGALLFAVWMAQAWAFVGSPYDLLKGYATHAHEYTDGTGLRAGVRPTVVGRFEFYAIAWFFQTAPALIAIPLSFFLPRTHHPRLAGELFRFWIPASLLVYFGCILLTGGYYPRLAVVTFPLSMLLLVEVIWSVWHHASLNKAILLPVLLVLLPVGAITGVQGYEVAEMIGRKILQPPPLPAALVTELRAYTTKRDVIIMPKFYKITRHSNGRHLRVYARRDIVNFNDPVKPSLDRIISRTLAEEIADFEPYVPEYLAAVPSGMFFLVPVHYKEQIDPQAVVFEKEGWILGRAPE